MNTIFTSLFAQTLQSTNAQGKITGAIHDAKTNEPLSYATIVLLNRKTKAHVRTVQADDKGVFTIEKVAPAVYTFKASYMGYQTMVRDSLAITPQTLTVNLNILRMKPSKGSALKEVTITAARPDMQLGIDKKIFSVNQSLVSEGGSASDLLQNVPSVQVDMDGNVSLRGSTGVRVLVDGKPSLIAGGDLAQILQSIPASSIETVEIVTNPSAKYDAEGQAGIINIVLKKNKKIGFNGSVALGAGNRDNFNGNTSLSFQNSKVNLYGNYSYRYGNRLGGGRNNIIYLNPINSLTYANQNTHSKDLEKGHQIKLGVDYYLAEKSIISLSSGINLRNEDENDLLNINQLNGHYNPLNLSNRNNTEDNKGRNLDLNLDFSQKFKKPKEEITANFGYAHGTNNSYQIYTTNIYNINGNNANDIDIQRTDRGSINRNYNAQVDYALPLGKQGKFETGYRSQIRLANSNTYADQLNPSSNLYHFNTKVSNIFNSTDQVHALYLNYQNQLKNFGYQIGLRGEDALLNTNMGAYDANTKLSYSPGKVAYTRLYPSVFLTQNLPHNQQIQVSYSRRVNRPRPWDTNPFIDVSNPLNHRQGNPNLLPEDVHAFELSYNKNWPKVTFISSIYYRQTNDVIQRIRSEADQDGITIVTPKNLARSINSGVELIGKFSLLKAWNFTANINLYQRNISGSPTSEALQRNGFSYNGNLTQNFTLPYNITLQVRGEYSSREVIAQGIRKPNYWVDAGAKYDFKNRRASLSLNIKDMFNTRRWMMLNENTNTILDFTRYRLGQQLNLTFSYRFGGADLFKKPKKNSPNDQAQPGGGEEQF